MEQVNIKSWPFDISPDTAVVTTTYVTQKKKPILYVTHEYDKEEGFIWQFHCGNGDYDPSVLQLIRLDEILEIDNGIRELASLPLGFCAKRNSVVAQWELQRLT